MRTIDYIIIHCSATKPSQDIDVKDIARWHKQRGWSDVGYNYFIKRNGTIQRGRDLDHDGFVIEEIGAHVRGYNSRSIGICYEGGIDENKKAEDNRTAEQKESLATLLFTLKELIPKAKIRGHRDFPNVRKSCPSFEVSEWLEEIGLKQ